MACCIYSNPFPNAHPLSESHRSSRTTYFSYFSPVSTTISEGRQCRRGIEWISYRKPPQMALHSHHHWQRSVYARSHVRSHNNIQASPLGPCHRINVKITESKLVNMSETAPEPTFKKSTFADSVTGKKRVWKSLKQILATERTLQWPEEAVTCNWIIHCANTHRKILYVIFLSLDSALNAPPSFRPAKKYSDVSGLIALYTDPQSKLNYHNAEEFVTVRNLPSDLTAGYLALRGASSIVG